MVEDIHTIAKSLWFVSFIFGVVSSIITCYLLCNRYWIVQRSIENIKSILITLVIFLELHIGLKVTKMALKASTLWYIATINQSNLITYGIFERIHSWNNVKLLFTLHSERSCETVPPFQHALRVSISSLASELLDLFVLFLLLMSDATNCFHTNWSLSTEFAITAAKQ